MRWLPALLLAFLLAPLAASQDVSYFPGGDPGVRVVLAGAPIELAQTPAAAVLLDPAQPVDVSITLAPPANTTWEVRFVSVGLLVRGIDSEPPAALTRRMAADATLPPGYTVVVNRSIDLAALQRVGAGTFLMRADVIAADDSMLYSQPFFVKVPGGVAQLLTVQGAAITAASVATGYGLWQVLKDVHELREARNRHRREQRERLLSVDVLGSAEDIAERGAEKLGRPFAAVVGLKRSAKQSERKLAPIRWTATGMGLGGVAIAWLQFFGYLALDAMHLVVTALEVGAVALTVALLVNALVQRRKQKREAQREAEQTRTLEVKTPVRLAAESYDARPEARGPDDSGS